VIREKPRRVNAQTVRYGFTTGLDAQDLERGHADALGTRTEGSKTPTNGLRGETAEPGDSMILTFERLRVKSTNRYLHGPRRRPILADESSHLRVHRRQTSLAAHRPPLATVPDVPNTTPVDRHHARSPTTNWSMTVFGKPHQGNHAAVDTLFRLHRSRNGTADIRPCKTTPEPGWYDPATGN